MVAHPRQELDRLAAAPVLIEPQCRCHGSPYDRGDSDAYYGRQWRPHKWLDGIGRIEVSSLGVDEIAEYDAGFDQNPSGRKDWF